MKATIKKNSCSIHLHFVTTIFALIVCNTLSAFSAPEINASADKIVVTNYLPQDYKTDGTVSYQIEIQSALDDAAGTGTTVIFPAMDYLIDENGFQIGSHLTLSMYGAIFRVSGSAKVDGQVFLGEGITDVQFFGGEVVGRNDIWPDGVNIRGVNLKGPVQRIRIRDMYFHDLSSAGIGIYATANSMASDIWVNDVIVDNCCNFYGDYLSERVGPEPGSEREDQGSVAF